MRTVTMTVSSERPMYLKSTLDSWADVDRDGWRFHFGIEPGRYQQECYEMIGDWMIHGTDCRYVNEARQGVLNNPFICLGRAFDGTSFAVLAEEDVLVSNDVLAYMDWAAHAYREDRQVMGVCAFSRRRHTFGSHRVERLDDFCPLIWGTWADRWSSIRDGWHEAARGTKGVEHGWDWGMQRMRAQFGRKFLFPQSSRSQHIGVEGVHCTKHIFPGTRAHTFSTVYEPVTWIEGK